MFKRDIRILCKCGCGKEKYLYNSAYRKTYYLPGHYPKTTEHVYGWVLSRKINGWFKNPEEQRKKARLGRLNKKLELANNWQGGKTPLQKLIRNSLLYLRWRKEVFERDDYTCHECKQYGGNLEVHHIKSFSKYPELRFDLDNGQTLCISCHKIKNRNQMIGNTYGYNKGHKNISKYVIDHNTIGNLGGIRDAASTTDAIS